MQVVGREKVRYTPSGDTNTADWRRGPLLVVTVDVDGKFLYHSSYGFLRLLLSGVLADYGSFEGYEVNSHRLGMYSH